MTTTQETDAYLDDFLEHYGKKGMHWGVRSPRQRNKELNRRSRAKERAQNVRKIEKARSRVDTGKTEREYRKVKSAHAANKQKLGSREARKILREAKQKRYDDHDVAMRAKNGKEVATTVLAGAAAFGLTYAAMRALGG